MPIQHNPAAPKNRMVVPSRLERVNTLFLKPKAKMRAIIPLMIRPELKIIMVVGVLALGLSGNNGGEITMPPRSLNQFFVQLKFGEYEIARNTEAIPMIGEITPHRPEILIKRFEPDKIYPKIYSIV